MCIFANLIMNTLFSTINQYQQIPVFIHSLKVRHPVFAGGWLLLLGSSLKSWWQKGLKVEWCLRVTTSRDTSLSYPAQQASMNNKELFQDHTSLRAALGLQYGSNCLCLNTCLSPMNCIRVILLFSLYPADVLFKFANII